MPDRIDILIAAGNAEIDRREHLRNLVGLDEIGIGIAKTPGGDA